MPISMPSSRLAWPWISVGSMRTPPLAMVLTAAAICMAFTESDWPKAIRSPIWLFHTLGSGRLPRDSAPSPTLVGWPRPNLARYARSSPGANLSEASTVPTFDDLASTPASVSLISPCSQWSWMTRSCRCSSPGTSILVRALTLPVSMSAESVSTFSTEPGS